MAGLVPAIQPIRVALGLAEKLDGRLEGGHDEIELGCAYFFGPMSAVSKPG